MKTIRRMTKKELKEEVKTIIENFDMDLMELYNTRGKLAQNYIKSKDSKDHEKISKHLKKIEYLDAALDNLKKYYKYL